MDKLKKQIEEQKINLIYINNQQILIKNNIELLEKKLYNLCKHKNTEKKSNYYDSYSILCLDCGYEY